MLTVRFPNGQAVQYNDAAFLYQGSNSWELYSDSSKTNWIASIQPSAGAVIEAVHPCEISNPLSEQSEASALKSLLAMFEEGRHPQGCGDLVGRMKKELARFNTHTWGWKPKAGAK